MRVALIGVGRMGSAIAERLRRAGHELSLYDVRHEAGFAASLALAVGGAELAFFCLPDEAGVRQAASELAAVRVPPPLLVDLTSSLPATTRLVAGQLARRGIRMLDVPLSGGVAGAREGRLTAMAGGPAELLELARPALSAFASNIVWAGPLGAGHAMKAVNNALSAASLAMTAEMLVRAARAGADPRAVIADWNRGPARSQNSEVKFPRDILPGSYAAGFTAGFMEKDVATALRMAEAHALPLAVTKSVHAVWRAALAELGAAADFTRIHQHFQSRPSGGGGTVHEMGRAIAAVCLLAGRELIPLAVREGVERDRALGIVNASTGRSEATRAGLAWELDSEALSACAPILVLGGE
jgi:3-hydroxyisobutyrate dehydrogenase